MLDIEKQVFDSIRDGIRDGVKQRLANGYTDNPIAKLIDGVLKNHDAEFRTLLTEGLASCFSDAEFRENIKQSVRHTLAKTLIARFGGELEKQVNVLKSDPATRARITLAIEEIVKDRITA